MPYGHGGPPLHRRWRPHMLKEAEILDVPERRPPPTITHGGSCPGQRVLSDGSTQYLCKKK